MSSQDALKPLEQKQVYFYDDEITVVRVQEGEQEAIYVSIRQMCDLLGVAYQGQIRRINDDAVLSRKVKGVNITFTSSSDRGGGPQVTNCLPIDYLNGWLFSMNARRVKEEVRERLILYQEKCYGVLAEAFRNQELSLDPEVDELLAHGDSEAAQAYRLLQALVKLARNQVVMESQLSEQTRRLTTHDEQLASFGARLEDIETALASPARYVSPDQAMQVSQAVKAIALTLGKQTKRNEFGAVYGELYRKFGITSYKQLPAGRFEDAMRFLTEWHESVSGDLPF